MKRLLLFFLLFPVLATGEPDLRKQLSDALYAEEVTRDPAAAAEAYEKILADFDQQRPLAASALFRLAEVRRKQDRNDDAIALYQRLLREFGDAESEAKLARQNLVALGASAPEANPEEESEFAKEIKRYEEMAQNSPDIFQQPHTFTSVVSEGNIELVRTLLELGADPNHGMAMAAEQGYLEIIKLLVSAGADLTGPEARSALKVAILVPRTEVVALLFESGLSLEDLKKSEGYVSPLVANCGSFTKEIFTLLLENGADINGFSQLEGKMMTPLMAAIDNDNLMAFRFFLEQGADPKLTYPKTGRTALLTAMTTRNYHQLKFVRELLNKGVDVNGSFVGELVTPIHYATSLGGSLGQALLTEILKYNTGLNQKAKLNPLSVDNGWWYDIDGRTPLEIALKGKSDPMVEMLLKAGAPITADNLLSSLKKSSDSKFRDLFLAHLPDFEPGDEKASEALEKLAWRGFDIVPMLEKGATPSQEWRAKFFRGASGESLKVLNEKFLYPELTSGEQITLFQPCSRFQPQWSFSGSSKFILAQKSGSAAPPSLSKILNNQPPQLLFEQLSSGRRQLKTSWKLWRKNADGELEASSFDIASEQPLPELRWGDLLEIRVVEPEPKWTLGTDPFAGQRSGIEEPTFQWGSSNSLIWNLRKRISFPLTLTVGERTREITMRGDRVVYDPTLPEMPVLDTGTLMQYLESENLRTLSTLTIQREGSQDVILKEGKKKWPQFELQAHDHLIVSFEEQDESEELRLRLSRVSLVVSNNDSVVFTQKVATPELAPTLVELLAAAYAPGARLEVGALPKEETARLGRIVATLSYFSPKVLPHPDFKSIRIRRINETGEEESIEINLAQAISACNEKTTPAVAQSLDVALRPGDIVELPLMKEPEPWSGFTDSQILFFEKVLSGSFQETDKDGLVTVQEMDWVPVIWTPSAGGLLPLVPKEGVVSTRPKDVLRSVRNLELTRGGQIFAEAANFYLRNGDQIQPMGNRPKVRRSPVPPKE